MKKLCLITLFYLPFLSGCGYMMLEQKLHEAKLERQAEILVDIEYRALKHSIEGKILEVSMVDGFIEYTNPNPEHSMVGNSVTVSTAKLKEPHKFFHVKFEDGREIEFRNLSEKPLDVGKYYIIKYNGLNEITSVEKGSD